MASVYVIRGEDDSLSGLHRYLSLLGMTVRVLGADEALADPSAVVRAGVVVVDGDLPGTDGFALVARLRAIASFRIVMVTERDSLDDRVLALNVGADAYLVKPVVLRELEAVIRNLHRRLHDDLASARSEGEGGSPWVFDALNWTLMSPGGHLTQLTNAEYRVLSRLTERAGTTVSREEIAAALGKMVGGYDDRSIDAVMTRLRRKVGGGGEVLPVRAVRSAGYVFAATVQILAHADKQHGADGRARPLVAVPGEVSRPGALN